MVIIIVLIDYVNGKESSWNHIAYAMGLLLGILSYGNNYVTISHTNLQWTAFTPCVLRLLKLFVLTVSWRMINIWNWSSTIKNKINRETLQEKKGGCTNWTLTDTMVGTGIFYLCDELHLCVITYCVIISSSLLIPARDFLWEVF